MRLFDTIQGYEVFALDDGSYTYVARAEIDGDGAGGNPEGDPDFQSTTSLRHTDGSYLNLRTESVIVLPPALIFGPVPVVLGCKAQVRSLINDVLVPAVVGEQGPADKLGELSIHTADLLGIPSNPRTGGCPLPLFAYRFWPGVAADGYALQRA